MVSISRVVFVWSEVGLVSRTSGRCGNSESEKDPLRTAVVGVEVEEV